MNISASKWRIDVRGSAAVTQVRDNGLNQGGGSDDEKGGEGVRETVED